MQSSMLRTVRVSLHKANQLTSIFPENKNKLLSLWNNLLTCTRHAIHHMFDEIPKPNALISTLSQHVNTNHEALFLASRMHNSGIKFDTYALVCLIRASTNLGKIFVGQQLHSYVLRSGFQFNIFIATTLVSFYVKFEYLDNAHQLFDEIPQPNVVSWNSLISGYVQIGHCLKALALVFDLLRSNLRPDSFTFTAALTACTQLCLFDLGASVHCEIVKFGLDLNVVVGNCLLDMYGKCGFVDYAILAFHEMKNKDVVSWNSVIGVSSRNRRIKEAFDLLHQMPVPDTISYNEVINSIAQFGNMEDALRILFQMPNPNSSSWNSIISGYIKRNKAQEALDFFSKMHRQEVVKDQFTFSIILRGVASISMLNYGMSIHCCTIKSGFESFVIVGSALIDMYSKCGQINKAETIFGLLPRRNLVSWNAMISGYAHNGNARAVVLMFEQLKTLQGLKPDEITFVSVLSACAQDVGLLQDGIRYFNLMIDDYQIKPTPEHCSCMIDLMGLGGDILRAERMICELGFESCGLVWRALLGACGTCGDLKVAEIAAEKVLELEGDNEFVYVLLSNLYASHGRWGDVSDIRELMKERGLRKEAGCSWIERENAVPNCIY
ncbi:pentatricopeptide repeat (PPR) superfamily protein [Tasmannia lanceolata]|uniref:pentatricopeptide repeat (PPR) superfamily protein n=1 Tax=Tasmannia lanceolata TaxID=3420 RepID=UPI004062CB34